MSIADRIGGTRERILVLLRRHGRLSAPRLAGLLDLAPVGIRRHLALLERDGLVTAQVEKPRRGRPTAVYLLTHAGLETFPRHFREAAREGTIFDGNVRCVTHFKVDARGKDTSIQMRSKLRSTPAPTHMPARSEA